MSVALNQIPEQTPRYDCHYCEYRGDFAWTFESRELEYHGDSDHYYGPVIGGGLKMQDVEHRECPDCGALLGVSFTVGPRKR